MRDRGAADALGLVLIAPAILALALLVISLGRGVDAKAQVRSAAESAAQAAALERSPSAAGAAAQRAVESMLANSSTCDEPTVVTVYPPTPPSGATVNVGVVRVTVTCRVSDRGIEVIRQPYDESVTAVATIDFFRARR
jgi:Flp pilus assembly protein TadG